MTHEATAISKEFPKGLEIEYCFECGICTAGCPIARVMPQYYNPRITLQSIFFNLNKAITENKIWLCAWCDRCRERCPQKLNIPEILMSARNAAIESGFLKNFGEALELIGKEIPFPGVLGLVCLSRVDDPQSHEALKHIIADYVLRKSSEKVTPIRKKHSKKVAVIGSGPAGLMAAYELVMLGYPVTVFDSLSEPGGMFRWGIPEHRLPREVLDAEIKHIMKIGVKIKTNTHIGKDLTLDELLRERYKAIFIATGAHKSIHLGIEGEGLKGVIYALEFLKNAKLENHFELVQKAAVIGGGNVAIDVARTLLRLGLKSVNILYRRSREEMPANSFEVKQAEIEGVNFHFLVTPKKILGKDGRATAVECSRMKLGEPDESGRRRPIPMDGSEFITETDMVILAIGETPDLSFLPEGIEVSKNTIVVDPVTLETSMPGIFAGGDVVLGPASVSEAIASGKRAAYYIDLFLQRQSKNQKRG